MVVFKNRALKLVPNVLFHDTICFLSYTSSFSGKKAVDRCVFRLNPPKIHWEKNLYTLTQQVGRRNSRRSRRDDVKIPEENVIDGKPATKLLGRGGTESFLSYVSKELTVENNQISTKNKQNHL